MNAVCDDNTEGVRIALERGGIKPETLAAALGTASSGDNRNEEIREMLIRAGAVPPPEVDAAILQSYVGKYKGEHGAEFNVILNNGRLFAAPGGQIAHEFDSG